MPRMSDYLERDVKLVLDQLARLRDNPDETPERRELAAATIDRSMTDLPLTFGQAPWARSHAPLHRGHSGGDSLHQDAIYDGWDDRG
jgi:hypothetical protein